MRCLVYGLAAMVLALAMPCAKAFSAPGEPGNVVAGAPGRIEGSQVPIAIGASITGIVEKVAVRQGDRVSKGDLLVQIACDDVKERLAARIAEYNAANAFYAKLVNGPRPEEISIAEAELALATARLEEALLRVERSSTLLSSNSGSRATHDVDARDLHMAEAQRSAARYRLQLLKAGTRKEELAEAEYKAAAAKGLVGETKAELAKCEIRSPINGIVLRKEVSVGELASVFYPKPLLVVSPFDKFRVRAEVDEHDVTQVLLGQNAVIVINGSSQRRLQGKVSKIAPIMGRRKILTSDPADKSDRDVMEVLIDLKEEPRDLPIGLRVSVVFLK